MGSEETDSIFDRLLRAFKPFQAFDWLWNACKHFHPPFPFCPHLTKKALMLLPWVPVGSSNHTSPEHAQESSPQSSPLTTIKAELSPFSDLTSHLQTSLGASPASPRMWLINLFRPCGVNVMSSILRMMLTPDPQFAFGVSIISLQGGHNKRDWMLGPVILLRQGWMVGPSFHHCFPVITVTIIFEGTIFMAIFYQTALLHYCAKASFKDETSAL